MISAIIVWGSLLGAIMFTVAYLISPRLRTQVEKPKFQFLQQLQNFDRDVTRTSEHERGQPHEPE